MASPQISETACSDLGGSHIERRKARSDGGWSGGDKVRGGEGERERQVAEQSSEEAQMGWRGKTLSSHAETIPADHTQPIFISFFFFLNKLDLAKTPKAAKVGQPSPLIC